jgi:glycosyltransferase involved in cell wall biosynthesis
MGILRDLIPQVRGLVMYAQAERQLAERLYGAPADQLRCVFGLGVDSDIQADGERFRRKYGLSDRFVLYVGRKESGKNLPLLLAYWRRYKAQGGEGKLVLVGSGHMRIEPDLQPHVVDLGFVPAQDKYDAYAAASVLCQPSQNESFSFVIMESWLAGTPVLVHGACAVTREHVNAANGGLYFHTYEEFAATVAYLLQHEAIGRRMAAQGRRYVLQNYTWEIVTGKYMQLIDQVARELASGGVVEHATPG